MQTTDTYKIVIMGLDNSGKTSIILSHFKKEKNLLTYLHLTPTLGYKISEVKDGDKTIVLWDFGGQEQYREKYMQNLLTHLEESEELYFVLDVQDTERYDDAIRYFEDIVRFIDSLDVKPKITLFLHKCDPDLETICPEVCNESLADICQRFYQKRPEKTEFAVNKSTIYTVFEKEPFKFMSYS